MAFTFIDPRSVPVNNASQNGAPFVDINAMPIKNAFRRLLFCVHTIDTMRCIVTRFLFASMLVMVIYEYATLLIVHISKT